MKLFGSLHEIVSLLFRKNSQEITLRPNQATTYTANRDIQTPPQDADSVLVSQNASQTLTNKTINGANNTLTVRAASDITGQLPTANGGTGVNSTATFPTSGVVVTEAATETLTNKTINGASNTLTVLAGSQLSGQVPTANGGTGQNSTATFPTSGVVVTEAATETLSNKTLDNTSTINIKDTLLTIQDDGDTTKRLRFQVSSVTTGTTRTLIAPNEDTTIVGDGATQTLTNKTINGASNTLTVLAGSQLSGQVPTANGGTGQNSTATFPTSGVVVTEAATETLTNKTLGVTNTLTGATASSFTNTGTVTLFTSSDTVVGKATTDTLTNKTLTSPDINTQIRLLNQGQLQLREGTGGGTDQINIQAPATLAASYTLTLPPDDGNSSEFLKTDGAGVLTWATPAGAQDSVLDFKNGALDVTVAANAITFALKDKGGVNPSSGSPVNIGFRNATSANGTYSVVSVTAALSMTVSSGSTLGHASGVVHYIYVYLLNNAGTAELAVSSSVFDEGTTQSTTAEGGAGAADSIAVMYSTTARSNVPIRMIGRVKVSEATAGTWATSPSEITVGGFDKEPIVMKYQGSNTTIATGGQVTVGFATKVHDSHNGFSTNAYTVPKTGIYLVQSYLQWASVNVTQGNRFNMYVTKNNNNVQILGRHEVQTTYSSAVAWTGGATLVQCSAGDVLRISVQQNTGNSTTLSGVDDQTNFCVTYVGDASGSQLVP